MAIVIDGNNTPTAGGIGYGDGTELAFTTAGSAGGILYSAGSSAPAFSAAGTSGQPVVSGGAGAPTFRPYTLPAADGSASQVLQTDGAGALSFATPSTGALVFLSTVTASNSATVDIETTFDSTYDRYILEAVDVRTVDSGVVVGAQYKLSGSYVTTTTYAFHRMQPNDSSASYSGSALAAGAASSIGITAASGRSQFTMHITNPSSTGVQKLVYWTGGSISSDAVTVRAGAGLNQGTGALTGIRFIAATGNILSGTFRLYGIANS
jgi:hypothetical protein